MIETLIVVLSLQLMIGYDGMGNEVYRTNVAVGQPGHETPVAETTITNVIVHPWWHPTYGGRAGVPPRDADNQMGVAKITMKGMGNIRIHGTDTFGDSLNGPRYMSSGCVRVLQREMQKLVHLLVGQVDWNKENQWMTPARTVKVTIRS